MSKRRTQIAITVDDEMLAELEDYRFNNRFPTRASALVSLVVKGMEAVKEEQRETGKE